MWLGWPLRFSGLDTELSVAKALGLHGNKHISTPVPCPRPAAAAQRPHTQGAASAWAGRANLFLVQRQLLPNPLGKSGWRNVDTKCELKVCLPPPRSPRLMLFLLTGVDTARWDVPETLPSSRQMWGESKDCHGPVSRWKCRGQDVRSQVITAWGSL